MNTSYRQSAAYRAAVRIAAIQRAAMRHRVAMLENVNGQPLSLRHIPGMQS